MIITGGEVDNDPKPLFDARMRTPFSLRQAAKVIGVSASTLSRWEMGKDVCPYTPESYEATLNWCYAQLTPEEKARIK